MEGAARLQLAQPVGSQCAICWMADDESESRFQLYAQARTVAAVRCRRHRHLQPPWVERRQIDGVLRLRFLPARIVDHLRLAILLDH
jgi:hypothetical protein